MPGEHLEADTALRQVLHDGDQVFEVTTKTVEFPYDENVLVPEGFETSGQPRTVRAVPRGAILVDLFRLDPSCPEGILLQIEDLRTISL